MLRGALRFRLIEPAIKRLLIDHELHRRITPERPGVWAGFVGLIHDALGLGALDAGKLSVKIDRKVVTAGIVFIEVHDSAEFRVV